MIRVLIVDDSMTVRKTIADRLRAAGMEVVGEAVDGLEGVALTHRLRPEVVLMDVVMPRLDGLAATRRIMAEIPTPIVILSGHANQEDVFKTFDALVAGALEICAKPVEGSAEGRQAWEGIIHTVRAAAQAPVMRLQQSADTPEALSTTEPKSPATGAAQPEERIVVIGASTGGLAAIRKILCDLPHDFPLPIMVALHCSYSLPTTIAAWLDAQCSLNVCDARDREPLPATPGTVIVAPPGWNLRIRRGRMVLDDARAGTSCSPSVDELFTSAADDCGDATIGVLLTGMGADGAQGLRRIRDRGGRTIAQDEASCAVFGMPAVAIKLGAAEHVKPLQQIPKLLVQLAGSSCGKGKPQECTHDHR